MKKLSMQQKFNNAMNRGRILSLSQIEKIGFANVYVPATRARMKGIPVVLTTKREGGKAVTAYRKLV